MMVSRRIVAAILLALLVWPLSAQAALVQRSTLMDSTLTNSVVVTNTTPGASDYALVVRNIPSGTQTVSGTVTANAGTGTFTVDSELPSAGALADSAANPTAPMMGAAALGFNGTTWDRLRTVSTGVLKIATFDSAGTAITLTASTGGSGLPVTVQNASTVVSAGLDSTGTGISAVGLVGQFDDTSTAAVTENQFAPVRVDSARNLRVNCAVGCTSSAVATGTAHGTTDNGNLAITVRRDTRAVDAGVADGDNSTLSVDSVGQLYVNGDITRIGGNVVLTGGSNGSLGVGGLAASGATKAGNPVLQGGVFNTTQPTVTNGQAVDQQHTARGALIIAKGVEGFALDANQSVNIAQIGGTTTSTGAGVSGNGVIRVAPAVNAEVCNPKDTAQVAVAVSSSGNNEIVALTAGQTIYVCDVTLVSDGTVAVQFIHGTGTACATGETDMSGAMSLVANTGWTHNYSGRLKTAEANALCIELSGAVAVNGVVTYRKVATF